MSPIYQRVLLGCVIGVMVVAASALAVRPDPLIRILRIEANIPVVRLLLPKKVDSPEHIRNVRIACISAAAIGVALLMLIVFFATPVPPRK